MARRNRIDMSKQLFERLIVAAQQRGVEIVNSTKKRYIRKLSDDDSELMASGDAKALVISRHVRIVRISFRDETYFCVFGLSEPDATPPGLEPVELTPALFSIAILEAQVQPAGSVSGFAICEVIDGNFMGTEGYQGHDLEDIERLFPHILVYRVKSGEPYLFNGEHRVLGALIARSYADGPISISAETLENLWFTFEYGSKFIPYRNLVQGLMAISWESLFLEAYRCLEQLYAEPHVSALKNHWPSTLPLRDLAAMLEQHLSWRPKEDEALVKIIAMCDSELMQRLCTAFGVGALEGNSAAQAKLVSRKIYALRNNVVHYRPIHEEIIKTNEEWDAIVSALIDVINKVYDTRGTPFFESEAEPPIEVAAEGASPFPVAGCSKPAFLAAAHIKG